MASNQLKYRNTGASERDMGNFLTAPVMQVIPQRVADQSYASFPTAHGIAVRAHVIKVGYLRGEFYLFSSSGSSISLVQLWLHFA